ncbi:hypothetical protein MMC09_000089 [Bachmanniomyces sp. S44760]|nr:hypothetical protein [Bachmanniomyces sp. S44760]
MTSYEQYLAYDKRPEGLPFADLENGQVVVVPGEVFCRLDINHDQLLPAEMCSNTKKFSNTGNLRAHLKSHKTIPIATTAGALSNDAKVQIKRTYDSWIAAINHAQVPYDPANSTPGPSTINTTPVKPRRQPAETAPEPAKLPVPTRKTKNGVVPNAAAMRRILGKNKTEQCEHCSQGKYKCFDPETQDICDFFRQFKTWKTDSSSELSSDDEEEEEGEEV